MKVQRFVCPLTGCDRSGEISDSEEKALEGFLAHLRNDHDREHLVSYLATNPANYRTYTLEPA